MPRHAPAPVRYRPGVAGPFFLLLFTCLPNLTTAETADPGFDPRKAQWNDVHFPPQVDQVPDQTCASCHRALLTQAVREASPAGLSRDDAAAWYQSLNTYAGPQLTFHERHLTAPYAREVLRMACRDCHRGHDPRERAVIPDSPERPLALRKRVHPGICLRCHGQFPDHQPLLGNDWRAERADFDNDCRVCHAADRARRHTSPWLDAARIESLAIGNGDVCYGCHGGRAWYRVAYDARFDPLRTLPPPARTATDDGHR